MRLVSSAENSSLDWRAQYRYIQDIHDGRGYTAGIIGFCSGTGDMLEVVQAYTRARRHNPLARFIPALKRVNGSASHAGLGRSSSPPGGAPRSGPPSAARRTASATASTSSPRSPSRRPTGCSRSASSPTTTPPSCTASTACAASASGRSPAPRPRRQAATSAAYLEAFLDERVVEMRKEAAHEDVSRIETAQRRFLREGNLDLALPLRWAVYGDDYSIVR